MYVSIRDKFYSSKDAKKMKLSDFIAGELTSNEYASGRLEDMGREITKLRETLGNVMELLVERKVLTLEEALSAADIGDYRYEITACREG